MNKKKRNTKLTIALAIRSWSFGNFVPHTFLFSFFMSISLWLLALDSAHFVIYQIFLVILINLKKLMSNFWIKTWTSQNAVGSDDGYVRVVLITMYKTLNNPLIIIPFWIFIQFSFHFDWISSKALNPQCYTDILLHIIII